MGTNCLNLEKRQRRLLNTFKLSSVILVHFIFLFVIRLQILDLQHLSLSQRFTRPLSALDL